MKKEIGSEFWDIPKSNKKNDIFPENTKWFLSGRTALKYIIADCDIKSVAIPSWCCKSMTDPFVDASIEILYYDSIPNTNCDAVFLIDYFGYQTRKYEVDKYPGVVIRDVTHSVFSRKYNDADYYFGSLRKWAGFVTGGFAYGNWKNDIKINDVDKEYEAFRKEAMLQKKSYIEGKSDSKNYLNIFDKANNLLDSCKICSATEEDIIAAQYLDVDFLKRTRRQNAEYLLGKFKGLYKLEKDDCPLFVPIKVKNRDALRNYLIDHDIYCPVHWPNRDLDGTELSLVCDQRYGIEDMKRICEIINKFQNEGNEI